MWSAEAQVKNVLFLFLDKKKSRSQGSTYKKRDQTKTVAFCLPSGMIPIQRLFF
jgi:hypothetical protein